MLKLHTDIPLCVSFNSGSFVKLPIKNTLFMVSPYSVIFPAHCSAIALAIPGNVLLLNFWLRATPYVCPSFEVAATHGICSFSIKTGINGGNPFSHKYVRFVYGSPNS